jgi:hypothetical protein
MRSVRLAFIACSASLLALAACRIPADVPGFELPTVDLPEGAMPWPTEMGEGALEATLQARLAEGGFLYGDLARWPADIPDEIPPLEGEIERVTVVPGMRYRIAYSRISEQALAEYLASLESLGFQLDYIVYTAPSIPDADTQAKIARGEWDAVVITKGPYHMRLEFGDEGANLDIDNADFMTPGPPPRISPTPITWPSDIPDRVPQPASCVPFSLASLGGHRPPAYQIMLECSSDQVQEEFVRALEAAGLKETDRLVSDTGQNVYITLQDDEITVQASDDWGGHFTITIWGTEP